MGCVSSRYCRVVDVSNKINDKIPASSVVENENLLKNLQCRTSEVEGGKTKADREMQGRHGQSEQDREKEDNDSESLCLEGKRAKERHGKWRFTTGTQVKLIKSVPNSIAKGSVGVVKRLTYTVLGVKFENNISVKFTTEDIEEWLEVCCETDAKSFVDNVVCEMVQPVLFGSASIWAAVNTILDERKSHK